MLQFFFKLIGIFFEHISGLIFLDFPNFLVEFHTFLFRIFRKVKSMPDPRHWKYIYVSGYNRNNGPVTKKDMQTSPLRNGHLYMKVAQCAETNDKSCFRFFRFRGIGRQRFNQSATKKNHSKVAKLTGKMRIDLTMIFQFMSFLMTLFFCAILRFWVMVYFVFNSG